MYKVISFYKYIEIKNPEELMSSIREICISLNILGRVLIGNEGINGAVCGEISNIEEFKIRLKKYSNKSNRKLNKLFLDLTFREQTGDHQTYHKLVVRVREEIVVLGEKVNLKNKGEHVSPEKLKEWLDNKEDVVLLDARNEYEAEVGKFKDALVLPIENFRDLPKIVNENKELNKIKGNIKKIVMYCTGGVRCEKASALLKEKGFKEVYQLEGGIINYVNQFPNTHYEGSCYVFDDRKVSKTSAKIISKCEICKNKSDEYINCHNLDCDKLFICCNSCQEKLNKCCCIECKSSPRQRNKETNTPLDEKRKIIGKVENYYSKNGIVLIKSNLDLINNPKSTNKITISGNTTEEFDLELNNVKSHGEGLYTFPISKRVRKNDLVYV